MNVSNAIITLLTWPIYVTLLQNVMHFKSNVEMTCLYAKSISSILCFQFNWSLFPMNYYELFRFIDPISRLTNAYYNLNHHLVMLCAMS